jgi:hypothetical protein
VIQFGRLRFDPATALMAIAGGAGLIWLAPLMADQFVLFADQEQTRTAAASRQAMPLPTALVLVGAIGSGLRVTRMHGLLVALPAITAVPLALVLPDALYQVLAYAVTAPIALGALLSAAVPAARNVRVPVVLGGILLILAVTVLASPFTLMVLIALIVWWRLPTGGRPNVTGNERR